MNCPICNTTITDIKGTLFCPICHWELAAIPTNALLLKKDYEDRLILISSNNKNNDTIEDLSQKIQKAKLDNESISEQIGILKKQATAKREVLARIEKERCTLQGVQKELCKKQKLLKDAEKKIEEFKTKQQDLLELMDKVKSLDQAYRHAFRHGYGYRLGAVRKFLDDYKTVFSEYFNDAKG